MRQMKDSGIEWIGEIPESWDTAKLLYLLRKPISDGPHETPEVLNEGIPFISVDSLNDTEDIDFSVVKKFISEEQYVEYQRKANLEEGDILFSKAATIGKTAIVKKEKFMVWSPLAIIKVDQKKLFNKFLYYLLNCSNLINDIILNGSYNTQINVGMRELESAKIPVLSLSEQEHIANYLDQKCGQIDALIEAKEKTNALLRERRQSIIYEAVTKGLNSDAPMKDSGIEWIGMIPKDWVVGKTIYGLEMPITDGPHETPQLYNEGVPFISAEAVSCGNGNIDFNHIRGYISEEYYAECCKKYIPRINDIYMIKSGATTGKVAIVDTDRKFTIWSPLAVFRCAEHKCHYKYLYYFLQSDAYQKQVEASWSFGTQQNIGMRTLERLLICFPGVNEQKEIAVYLDACCSETDLMIAANEATIQKLKEYRQSIIYEAVTGKIEI